MRLYRQRPARYTSHGILSCCRSSRSDSPYLSAQDDPGYHPGPHWRQHHERRPPRRGTILLVESVASQRQDSRIRGGHELSVRAVCAASCFLRPTVCKNALRVLVPARQMDWPKPLSGHPRVTLNPVHDYLPLQERTTRLNGLETSALPSLGTLSEARVSPTTTRPSSQASPITTPCPS